MCINPVLLPNGQEVACHQCWQCVRRKIDDWTGRCVAESQTSLATRSVTLTYGRDRQLGTVDHLRSAILTYSDVQAYLRAMRDAGYPVRFFAVGEYGSAKGRAHWHVILFFKDKVPLRPLDQQFECKFWPHGLSWWQLASPEAVRYVTKYIAKEVETEDRQYHKAQSKIPPLGEEWFNQLAGEYVAQGLAPRDLSYSFDHVRDRHDRAVKFYMGGITADRFLRSFVCQWREARGDDHWPNSDLVDDFLDAEARRGSRDEAKRVLAAERAGILKLRDHGIGDSFTGTVRKPTTDDLRRWMDPDRLYFDGKLNVWAYPFEGGQRPWYWAKDAKGVYGWRAKIGETEYQPGPLYGREKFAGQ